MVHPQRGLGGVLDRGLGVLDRPQEGGELAGLGDVGLGHVGVLGLVEAQADEELDHRLLHGHRLDRRAALQRFGLHLPVGGCETPVALDQVVVDPGVLDDGEDVGRERAHGKEVEERADVGGGGRRAECLGDLAAEVVEAGRALVEVELEALELDVADLVGGDDLEPCEVLGLRLVSFAPFREEDGRAVGRGELDGDPADVLMREVGDGLELHRRPRERVGVHAQQPADALELDAGRELLDQVLGAHGLEPEESDAAVGVLPEQLDALGEPAVELHGADARQDVGRGAQEGADRLGRGVGEALGALEHDRLLVRGEAPQGLSGLQHEAGDVAHAHAGEALGEREVAAPQPAVDARGDARRGLEGAAHLAPARVGEDGGERDQLLALGDRGEHALAEHERLGGEVVGAVRERLDERDEELELAEVDVLREAAGELEEARGEVGRLPRAAREAAAERGPPGDVPGRDGRQDLGARPEVRGGDDGRVLGQLDAALDPPLELREADDRDDLGRGAEVLGRGLPSARPLLRDAHAPLGPAQRGGGPDGLLDGLAGRLVGFGQRRGVLPELAEHVVVLGGRHAAPPVSGDWAMNPSSWASIHAVAPKIR